MLGEQQVANGGIRVRGGPTSASRALDVPGGLPGEVPQSVIGNGDLDSRGVLLASSSPRVHRDNLIYLICLGDANFFWFCPREYHFTARTREVISLERTIPSGISSTAPSPNIDTNLYIDKLASELLRESDERYGASALASLTSPIFRMHRDNGDLLLRDSSHSQESLPK
jgi:hypothetical protein